MVCVTLNLNYKEAKVTKDFSLLTISLLRRLSIVAKNDKIENNIAPNHLPYLKKISLCALH